MKRILKTLKVTFLTAILAMITVSVFAQDSATVNEVNGVISFFANTSLGTKVFSSLFILSEILSLIPAKYIPANGVIHQLYIWVTTIKWPFKGKS